MSDFYTVAAINRNAAIFALILGGTVFFILLVSQISVRSKYKKKLGLERERVATKKPNAEMVKAVFRKIIPRMIAHSARLTAKTPKQIRSANRLKLAVERLGRKKSTLTAPELKDTVNPFSPTKPNSAGDDWYKIHEVIDGDTVDAWSKQSGRVRFRLSGIDAPERGQPDSELSTSWLKKNLMLKLVHIESCGKGEHGRALGQITVGKTSIEYQMVLRGLVWHDENYSPDRSDLAKAQLDAKKNRRGIWAAERPVPPWHWRRMGKDERDQFRV